MQKKAPKLSKEIYSSDEMERYLGALSERQDKKMETLVEGFHLINRKLDEHTEEFVKVHKILDAHTKLLNSHTEMVGHLMIMMNI
jgi:molecular chaperone GrpE (heat shock protein)